MTEQGRLGTLLSSLRYYVGRIELFVGLVSLGVAAFVLRLHTRERGTTRDWDMVFRLMTVMVAGVIATLLSGRPKKNRHPTLSPESGTGYLVRTG